MAGERKGTGRGQDRGNVPGSGTGGDTIEGIQSARNRDRQQDGGDAQNNDEFQKRVSDPRVAVGQS